LKVQAPIRREAPEKKPFFSVVPLHFLALKAQLVVLVHELSCDDQYSFLPHGVSATANTHGSAGEEGLPV